MKHNFKNLRFWQKSIELCTHVYILTEDFPKPEHYGLRSQIRRSAVSISSNIAEGCGRDSDRDIKHFLDMSIGSACELETQLYIANNLKYINEDATEGLTKEISHIRSMIIKFISNNL